MSSLLSSLEHFCVNASSADINQIRNEEDLFARLGIDIKPFEVVCLINLLNRITAERDFYRKKCEELEDTHVDAADAPDGKS